jgi:hypothetical protein
MGECRDEEVEVQEAIKEDTVNKEVFKEVRGLKAATANDPSTASERACPLSLLTVVGVTKEVDKEVPPAASTAKLVKAEALALMVDSRTLATLREEVSSSNKRKEWAQAQRVPLPLSPAPRPPTPTSKWLRRGVRCSPRLPLKWVPCK